MASPLQLVRWLPKIAEATAKDIARYGPNAARVRSILDFLPTMSDDAARISRDAYKGTDAAAWSAADAAADAAVSPVARDAAWSAARFPARYPAYNAALDAARDAARGAAWFPAGEAAVGESVSDLIDPRTYRTLTNPLAIGRALDVLRPRAPENFLDVVRGLGERGLVRQPVDVLSARTLARASDPERQALMEVINAIAGESGYADTGYDSLAELIEAARLLG